MKMTFTQFLLPLLLFFALPAISQPLKKGIDPNNVRIGDSVEYCVTHKIMEQILKDPVRLKNHNAYLAEQARLIAKNRLEKSNEKSMVYKIPIVFHVVHNGGPENISKEQILDQLAILNEDYRLKNEDANDVVQEFQGKPVDVGIEFVLATKAPDGTCFDGITRTKSSLSYNYGEWYPYEDQIDAIKTGNDVYRGEWPASQYLNIYIFGLLIPNGALGFTQNPNDNLNDPSGMYAGISILHSALGSIGTSQPKYKRTLTHEVGHWFNLQHTWGNGQLGASCGDDLVDDTPITKGYGGVCPLNASNNCDTLIVENVENYMEYSFCSKMFTQGQKERMIAALQSGMAGRNNIWSNENLQRTGTDGPILSICKVDFTSDKQTICPSESITLSDNTIHPPSGWLWKTPGGIPSESTEKNPTITYNTPGTYSVTLVNTLNNTTDSVTKTNFIRVLPIGKSIPFYESFENYSSISTSNTWSSFDEFGDRTFDIFSNAGYNGNKCLKLANYDEYNYNSSDALISPNFDISDVKQNEKVTLSFRYSYKKHLVANSDNISVFVSNSCGESWNIIKTISSSLPSTKETNSWVPSSQSDWLTVHVTNITNNYFTNNFRFVIQFTNGGKGNNLYIDDINLYKGNPSNDIVVGLNENPNAFSDLNVYPNPADGELNVQFHVPNNKEVSLNIHDITGKITQSNIVKANEGSNMVLMNTGDLAPGMYFLNVQIDNSQKTIQFVVK